ncbi:Gfa-like protein [Candidatus Rhodobacter oscarellae]|uniref:Gfa-like protein n=2 Tax=Candidatus Rhodobacter oscarellae TaxID=1675527 RepID=A0A0J9EDC0_9RHOB|nr:Gfa-like protein [Candidatus Rhodobacter lobularis]
MVSWFGLDKHGWEWTGAAPSRYASSAWAERWFCPTCGSPMGYRSDKLPKEMHGLAATLDEPELFAPGAHFFHSKALSWLHVRDQLPRYLDGGKTLDENA